MKNIYKQSTVLFMALAVIAMILTGCKKSDSNNGGGVTPVPPTSNYGTITFGNQSFTISHSGYTVDYDEDLQANIVGIGLATADDEKGAAIAIPLYSTVPTGQFSIVISETPEEGDAGLAIVLNSNSAYIATQGSITINQNGNNYTIDASGSSMALSGGDVKSFTVHFTGPLPYYEDED